MEKKLFQCNYSNTSSSVSQWYYSLHCYRTSPTINLRVVGSCKSRPHIAFFNYVEARHAKPIFPLWPASRTAKKINSILIKGSRPDKGTHSRRRSRRVKEKIWLQETITETHTYMSLPPFILGLFM